MADKLKDDEGVLLRQIHPNFYEKGEPASDRFRPSPNDENQLSLDRSSMVTAAASYELYTNNGYRSAAVFGVSVAEFTGENVACVADPLQKTDNLAANPAHAVADYRPHSPKSHKNIAKRLKRLAVARGRLHPPGE